MNKLCVSLCIFFLVVGASFAQEQYGHLRGVVVDDDGVPLPGVTVILDSTDVGARSITTGDRGLFRFINVTPGVCSLKCELGGFKTYIQENLDIRLGTNFDFRIVMEPATLQEEVTIIAESPIVDTKKVGTAFNVTETMLQEVPSSRDPWAILDQAPGIATDRENVGGIDSGWEPNWTSKGTVRNYFSTYSIDGVNVTNMAIVGRSNRYYDFDSFEEVQIVTTGQDPSIRAAGVAMNVVTRRGGNKFEFLGRVFFTNDKLQSDNRTQELIDLEYSGDQIDQLSDYGFQFGGPVVRDKMWFWLGYGMNDIRLISVDGSPNGTKIESFNTKLNFQFSRKDRGEVAFIYNDRRQWNVGIGPYRPQEATWDANTNGHPLVKLHYERMFSDNLLTTLKLAYGRSKRWWDPNGGMDTQAGYDYYTGIYSGTADYDINHMPDFSAQFSGNYFLEEFLGGGHEFKFGAEYRQSPDYGDHIYPGYIRKYYWKGEPLEAMVHRCLYDRASERINVHLNDAYTTGRLTLNLGVRLDWERFWNSEIDVPTNPIAPELMPGFTLPRIDVNPKLFTFSPRLGLTFDLTGDGKTILRANVARYGWWPNSLGSVMSVTEENQAWYNWKDLNGDDLVSNDELVGYPYEGLLAYSGFDPSDPTNPVSPYEIAQDLPAGTTDELLFGVERELFKDFALSANLTLRRQHDWNWWVRFNRETGQRDNRADWGDPIPGSIEVDGVTYNYEYWAPQTHRNMLPNQSFEGHQGWYFNYTGLEIIAVKRLSHRWMMNASFTLQRTSGNMGTYFDPTNIEYRNDGIWFFDPRWMIKLSFLYQLPWGFNFSGFANARDGRVARPQLQIYAPERRAKGYGSFVYLDVERTGETRYPNFYNVDLSLSKDFIFSSLGRLTLQVDAFNIFNFNHTLEQQNIINHPRYLEPSWVLNPRVIRFGVRYRF